MNRTKTAATLILVVAAGLTASMSCADRADVAMITGIDGRQPPTSPLRDGASGYDGRTLFRGLFFGEGIVGSTFPELFDGESSYSYAANADERQAIDSMRTLIETRIRDLNYGFFTRFSTGIQSGNHLTVEAYLDSAAKLLDQALVAILADSREQYEAVHCTDPNDPRCVQPTGVDPSLESTEVTTTSSGETSVNGGAWYEIPNGTYPYEMVANYDTIVVNVGDANKAAGVFVFKTFALAFNTVAALNLVAGVHRAVVLNQVIAANRFRVVERTKHWQMTRLESLDISGGGNELSHDYVVNLVTTRLAQ